MSIEVVQAAAAFVVVQGAFDWISDSYARIADWTALASRVASLLLALDQIDGHVRLDNVVMIAALADDELVAQRRVAGAD